ncbi:hypothetical protein [Chitinophaga sp.]|uniref:hypothetical protein n=1 Tax=Chitinophaga sp. TaxID=1869181 RepID=UPI0031D8A9CD
MLLNKIKEEEEGYIIEYNIPFTGIMVVQSLPSYETQTGKELYDDIIDRHCERLGYNSFFRNPYSKEEFKDVLNQIIDAILNKKHYWIIHLEMHGSENGNGLVLASGELVTWEELGRYCRPINIHLHNTLVITLAACNGINFYNAADFTKPAPFGIIVGPKQNIYNSDLLRDFTNFYDLLLCKFDLAPAIETLNIHDDGCKYSVLSAGLLFLKLRELAEAHPFNYSHLNRPQKREKMKDENHPLSGERYWTKLRKIFLME